MCKKLIYLMSFVLVLGLAGNALAEDRYPPDWCGAEGSTWAIWEFNVDPDPLDYIEPDGGYSGDTDPHFDPGAIVYGMAPEEVVACLGSGEGAPAYTFNGDGTITIADELWGRLNNWPEDAARKKRVRFQITYDPASGTPAGESETADGGDPWMYISDIVGGSTSTIIADEEGFLCFEYEFEDRNPAAESFVFIDSSGLVIDELIVDTICYEGAEPPSGPGRGEPPGQATNPNPSDEATDVCPSVVLSWTPGPFADTHDVYFGTNEADVTDANTTVQLGVLVSPGQTENYYPTVGTLDFGQTYYWRIDEVNDPNVWKGNIWQFTTEPYAYPITNVTATASSSYPGDDPNNTVNGSGLDANDLHSTDMSTMWTSDEESPGGAWIKYEFDKVYKLHEMWVWNYNRVRDSEPGFKDVTIEYSTDGSIWTTLVGAHQFAQALETDDYAHNTTVDFSVGAKYVRITAISNWQKKVSDLDYYGLSEVRFFVMEADATEESPESGTIGVAPDVVLSWKPGRGVVEHDVYISEYFDDVNDRSISPVTIPDDGSCRASYAPLSLELGKTYYWRVDEVNDANVWPGEIWNFRTYQTPDMGKITQELWFDIGGTAIADLTNDVDYPDNPDETSYPTMFEGPWDQYDDYGARIHGYLQPVTSGDYTFWISTDDNGELWLSTDEDPGNAVLIANEDVWSDYRAWETGDEQSAPISLVGGNRYYICALMKEGGGGDNLSVAWQGGPDSDQPLAPVDGEPDAIIDGYYLSPFLPLWAYGPNPRNGQELSADDVTVLSWKSGIKADTHTVYFGTSWDDVNDGTALVSFEQPANTYDPITGGDITEWVWETTYYWRIDEVNDANLWEGNVWSFTTTNYALVEDFEFYVETGSSSGDANKLRVVWTDGYATHPVFESGSNIMLARLARSELPLEYPREYLHYEDDDHYEGEQALAFYYDNDGNTVLPYWEQWARDYIYQPGKFSEISALTDGGDDLGIGRNWLRQDIKALSLWFKGNPTRTGSAEIIGSNATIIADGEGMDIGPGGTADYHDEFHYAYKLLQLDGIWPGYGEITARIDSIDPGAEAGVMMRDTVFPDSRYVMVVVTPGEVSLQFRDVTGEESTILTKTGLTLPQWVNLGRTDTGTFYAYHANDVGGSPGTWYEVPEFGENTVSSIMDPNVYVGLCVTSGNAAEMSAAVFSNVDIVPSGGSTVGDWQWEDIGIISNDPEPMYVALEDGTTPTPNVGVVYHPDSNAALIEDWTQWNIELQDFSDLGVNLADVNNIYIGFGDRVSRPGGGSGVVYFDDIRLYPPRCVLKYAPYADITDDCVVDYKDLRIMANDWLMGDETGTGLVARYEFDGDANDISGNGHDGTLNGGAITVYDALSDHNVLSLDGIDGYVDISNPETFNFETDFTWAAWIRTTNDGTILARAPATGDWAEGGKTFFLRDDGNVGVDIGWVTSFYADPAVDVNDDQWHHVAMTTVFETSGTDDTTTLYVDGTPAGSTDWNVNTYSEAGLAVKIGFTNDDFPDNASPWFTGLIDDVRIYDRALSDTDIVTIMGRGVSTGHYIPLVSVANLYEDEAEGDRYVNFKDFAVMADEWLLELLWP